MAARDKLKDNEKEEVEDTDMDDLVNDALDVPEDDEDYEDEEEDDENFFDDDDLDDGPLMRTGSRKERSRAPALVDPDVRDLNNPDVVTLGQQPMLGSHGRTEMFGEAANTFGRATSPKLYASAGQHPNCVQYRIWRMENGIPVGLGVIDSEATEEDFVRKFVHAMPRKGEGRYQFRLRPIDQRGNELGKEFPLNISEHHSVLQQMREVEAHNNFPGGWGRGGGDVIVQGGQDGSAAANMAEEMGRMFEMAVGAAEDQTKHYQTALEMERERLREEEKQRAQERVAMAERASTTTERMMERLMQSDRSRSEEAMKAQKSHSDLLMTTLTTVFQQQQEAQRSQAERAREADQIRLQQDREYFERQRLDAEERRRAERDEFERKRQNELEQMRIESQRREAELAARRDMEKEEARLRLEREKMEMEQRREELRQERERVRIESEERRAREQREFERKLALEREERERRERADRERWERERAEADRKRDEERREWERREALRREEMQREAERRREEMQVQMKTMEMNAQRDREHAERMADQARMEREQQREAAERREKIERDLREAADRERQRQYELQKFEMQQQKERDREHAERMVQLQKMQSGGGLLEQLGMETPELLQRLFGGSEDEGGWADAIPKVLGGIAEMGKVALQGQQQGGGPQGRTPRPSEPQRIPIQTPQGVRMLTVDQFQQLQQRQAELAAQQSAPVPVGNPGSFVPPVVDDGEDDDSDELPSAPFMPPEEEPDLSDDYKAAMAVNTTKRAKAAGLSLKQMRKVRRTLRDLATKIAVLPAEEWEGVIMAALLTDAETVVQYISSVTVYAAFAETKADPALVEQAIAILRASPLVPEGSIPFTEDDLTLYQEAMAAQAESEVEQVSTPDPAAMAAQLAREATDEQEKSE